MCDIFPSFVEAIKARSTISDDLFETAVTNKNSIHRASNDLVLRFKRNVSAKGEKDTFLKEAYLILDQINEIGSTLKDVELLYFPSRLGSGRLTTIKSHDLLNKNKSSSAIFGLNFDRDADLTDQDKDQIESRAKLYMQTCLKRIQVLEDAAGLKNIDKQNEIEEAESKSESSMSSFFMLPLINRSANAHAKVVGELRGSVVWFLQSKLIKASRTLQQIQQRRLDIAMRKYESYRVLRSAAAAEDPAGSDLPKPSNTTSSLLSPTSSTATTTSASNSVPGATTKILSSLSNKAAGAISTVASTISKTEPWKITERVLGASSPAMGESFLRQRKAGASNEDNVKGGDRSGSGSRGIGSHYVNDTVADDVVAEFMSSKQMALLENENEALMARFESGFESVRTATQSIQEISEMQNQMAFHLQAQEKAIEQLHSDAITATDNIEMANVHLKKAQKLFADSRLWVIVFFLVISFIVLFLDWFYG
ncbi:hypothetical protein HDU76_002156 [Blyttiomyces sp. JEL0837]|nr:hypothetical protein HDU76_002156 [Blyttiomyces sp. JEL0837]